MTQPAYTRLDVDERRRRLLVLGERLFTEHAYNDLSMAAIAREAGISKGLLYHYFPSKQDYFLATLSEAAGELAERLQVDPAQPPAQQLDATLAAFLAWVDDHADAYPKLLETAAAVPEVRAIVDGVRSATAQRIIDGIAPGRDAPRLRAAVHGWLAFADRAILDRLEHGDIDRDELRGLLLGALVGAIAAAGETLPAA